MKMTIDRAIKKLKGQQADFNEQYVDFGGINDAFNTAYEVMEKYQKIEQILKEPCIIPEGCYPILRKIKREVEDEKGD